MVSVRPGPGPGEPIILTLRALDTLQSLGLAPADLQALGGLDGLQGYGHALVPVEPPDGVVYLSDSGEALLRQFGCDDADILAIREDTGELAARQQATLRLLKKRQKTQDWKARHPGVQAQYQKAYRQRQKARQQTRGQKGSPGCHASPPAAPEGDPGSTP